jgi:LPXTG-motif cell wall-anchored protein
MRKILALAGLAGLLALLFAAPAQAAPPYAKCSDAYADGQANMPVGHPGYQSKLDVDKDGIACENPPPGFVPYVPPVTASASSASPSASVSASASASASASSTPSASVSPSASAVVGGASLPVTGSSALPALLGVGALMLAVGAGAIVVARRRRVRFESR